MVVKKEQEKTKFKNKYLQKMETQKEIAEEQGGGAKKPKAAYDTVPHFRVPAKKIDIFIGSFPEPPFEIEDPTWNESDENYYVLRIHYVDNGIHSSILNRKSPYIVCEKTFDRNARCAFCEGYNGTWQVLLRDMEEGEEKKALASVARQFKPQKKFIFPVLNLSLLNNEAPDCFGSEEMPDITDKKCIECPWQDACYRRQIGVESWQMGPQLKTAFDTAVEKLFGVYQPTEEDDEDWEDEFWKEFKGEERPEDFENSFSDLKEGVIWKLVIKTVKEGKKTTKIYQFKPVSVGKSLNVKHRKLWNETAIDMDKMKELFQPTHTYEDLYKKLPKDVRGALDTYLESLGLELPEAEEKPKKKSSAKSVEVKDDDDDDDDDDDEIDDEDDEEEEEKPKLKVVKKGRKKEIKPTTKMDDRGLKECFGEDQAYDTDNKICKNCPLFDQCGDVVNGELTLEEALELMESNNDEEEEEEEKPKKKSSSKKVEDEDEEEDEDEDEEDEKPVKKKSSKVTPVQSRLGKKLGKK